MGSILYFSSFLFYTHSLIRTELVYFAKSCSISSSLTKMEPYIWQNWLNWGNFLYFLPNSLWWIDYTIDLNSLLSLFHGFWVPPIKAKYVSIPAWLALARKMRQLWCPVPNLGLKRPCMFQLFSCIFSIIMRTSQGYLLVIRRRWWKIHGAEPLLANCRH